MMRPKLLVFIVFSFTLLFSQVAEAQTQFSYYNKTNTTAGPDGIMRFNLTSNGDCCADVSNPTWSEGFASFTNMTQTDYDNTISSNNLYASQTSADKDLMPAIHVDFQIEESVADIKWIRVDLEGGSDAGAAAGELAYMYCHLKLTLSH